MTWNDLEIFALGVYVGWFLTSIYHSDILAAFLKGFRS